MFSAWVGAALCFHSVLLPGPLVQLHQASPRVQKCELGAGSAVCALWWGAEGDWGSAGCTRGSAPPSPGSWPWHDSALLQALGWQRLRPDSALGAPATPVPPCLSHSLPSRLPNRYLSLLPRPVQMPWPSHIQFPGEVGPQECGAGPGLHCSWAPVGGRGWRGPFCLRARSRELCFTLSNPCFRGPALS